MTDIDKCRAADAEQHHISTMQMLFLRQKVRSLCFCETIGRVIALLSNNDFQLSAELAGSMTSEGHRSNSARHGRQQPKIQHDYRCVYAQL